MSGEITVNYTPQTSIQHRICYRKGASGDFCCLIDSTPSTIGVPKSFAFIVGNPPCGIVPPPDTESCDTQSYEGYVQPICEQEGSLNNRQGWIAYFPTNPSCLRYNVLCNDFAANPCPAFTYNPCDGTDPQTIDSVAYGDSFEICSFSNPSTQSPPPDASYVITENGTCCGCANYRIDLVRIAGGNIDATIYYTLCTKEAVAIHVTDEFTTCVNVIIDPNSSPESHSIYVIHSGNTTVTITPVVGCP